jgi:hypothetical protein
MSQSAALDCAVEASVRSAKPDTNDSSSRMRFDLASGLRFPHGPVGENVKVGASEGVSLLRSDGLKLGGTLGILLGTTEGLELGSVVGRYVGSAVRSKSSRLSELSVLGSSSACSALDVIAQTPPPPSVSSALDSMEHTEANSVH